MKHKVKVIILVSLFLAGTLTITLNIQPVKATDAPPILQTFSSSGKRLGGWFQLTTISHYSPSEFFDAYFLTPPYFAYTELIVQVNRLSQFGSWIRDVGILGQNYPSIEIVVYFFWDMANEDQWSQWTNYLDTIRGISSIKYVGIDGEHATYGGDFPDENPPYLQDLSDEELIALFDRARAEVAAKGKNFCNYYLTYGGDGFKNRYTQVGHIRFPCQGGTESWCDNQAESPFIGQSYGTYETHQFPGADPPDDPTEPVPSGQDNCALSQESYNRIIEHAVAKSDEVRHFIGFAVGFSTTAFTGVSGKTTNHIWDNPTWRSWIWQKQQQYTKIITSIAPHGPTASFQAHTTFVNAEMTFNASPSLPGWNGTHVLPIINYAWDFGDGTTTMKIDPIVEHTYTTVGDYTITLNVTDTQGNWNTTSQTMIANLVEFSLVTLYQVHLDLNHWFSEGTNLMVAFYTYDGVYQGNTMVWGGATPTWTELSTNITHLQGKPIEVVNLVLIDDFGNVLQTVTRFLVGRSHLTERLLELNQEWILAPPEQKSIILREIVNIDGQCPYAPMKPL